MTRQGAEQFLRHMSSDPGTREKVITEHKKLLRDLAAEKDMELTDAELVEAAEALTAAAAGELTDATVAVVTGGEILQGAPSCLAIGDVPNARVVGNPPPSAPA